MRVNRTLRPSFTLLPLLLIASTAHPQSSPIALSQIGAKAAADFQGDALAITAMGEGSATHTPAQDYESAFQNGWQGVMAWTSNGVDKCGSLDGVGPATRAFQAAHEQLVFPPSPDPTSSGSGIPAWVPGRQSPL
jgi:hypothetical protein